jgi:hypothetical protein
MSNAGRRAGGSQEGGPQHAVKPCRCGCWTIAVLGPGSPVAGAWACTRCGLVRVVAVQPREPTGLVSFPRLSLLERGDRMPPSPRRMR